MTSSEKRKTIELVDTCLEKHNMHRAQYIANGNIDDFRAAVMYQSDRESLLKRLGKGDEK